MITSGFVCGLSDVIAIDVEFPPSSYISVYGTSGDIVFLNTNGNAQFWPQAQLGFMYPIGAKKILSSAVVNGTLRTTTAVGLSYAAATRF